jgi:hypothetical protein
VDNLCLLCAPHNAHTARQVFGEARSATSRAEQSSALTPSSGVLAPSSHKSAGNANCTQLCATWASPEQKYAVRLRNYQKPSLAKTSSRASKQLSNCLCRAPGGRTSRQVRCTRLAELTELQTNESASRDADHSSSVPQLIDNAQVRESRRVCAGRIELMLIRRSLRRRG